MRDITIDNRWANQGGIGRYLFEITKKIEKKNLIIPDFPIFHPLEQFFLLYYLKRSKTNLYFTPGINPPILWNGPFIFTIHDLIPINYNEETSLLKQIYFKTLLKYGIKKAKKILTVSEFTKSEIIKLFNCKEEKIEVIYNGVDSKFKEKGEKYAPGFPYILYIGNKRPHKNIERAIIAYATSEYKNNLKFILSGNPTPELSKIIRKYKIENNIIFKGFIEENDLPTYYRGAKALLFPSLYEGFGLPALEAMACGTPVITSNVTSLPEIVKNAACLVNPYEIQSIKDGLNKTLSNTSYRKSLITSGLARAQKFNWDQSAEKFKNIFLKL